MRVIRTAQNPLLIGGSTATFLMLSNYGATKQRGEAEMKIGKPLRTVIVEPLELPVSDPTADPIPEPIAPEPESEPEQVPVAQ